MYDKFTSDYIANHIKYWTTQLDEKIGLSGSMILMTKKPWTVDRLGKHNNFCA